MRGLEGVGDLAQALDELLHQVVVLSRGFLAHSPLLEVARRERELVAPRLEISSGTFAPEGHPFVAIHADRLCVP